MTINFPRALEKVNWAISLRREKGEKAALTKFIASRWNVTGDTVASLFSKIFSPAEASE